MTENNSVEVPVEQGSNQEQETKPETAADYFGYPPEAFKEVVAEEQKEEEPEKSKETSSESIQDKVNQILREIKVDENGKFIYPDDISPELKAAVAAEKSRRDTQSAYTKAQQELKALQAELQALKSQLANHYTPQQLLDPETQAKLDQLKYENPDAWYQEMKRLEAEAQKKIDEQFEEVSKKAKEETEVEYRLRRLGEFNEQRQAEGKEPLTPEQLELHVPPIYAKQLLEGEIDFDTYLEKAVSFLEGPKTVAKPEEPPRTTDMSKITGSQNPIRENPEPQIDYSQITF